MVGYAPADIMHLMHYGSMFLALIGTILILLFYNLAILSDNKFPRVYAFLNFFLIGLIVFFIFYYTFGPPDTTFNGLVVRVILQKMMIYGEIVDLIFLGIGAYNVVKGGMHQAK